MREDMLCDTDDVAILFSFIPIVRGPIAIGPYIYGTIAIIPHL
jgi:hypothetical protein